MAKKKSAPKSGPPAVVPPPVDPERVEQTVKWFLAGEREFDVIVNAVKTWPDQDIKQLMAAVADHFLQMADIKNPAVIRGWAFGATQEVYRVALATNDPGAALRAIKQLMEIAGA